MANCSYCNTYILFGGVKDGTGRYCNATCHEGSALMSIAEQIPREDFERVLAEVYSGKCPSCSGPGPVDVHSAHYAWSIVVMTSWGQKSKVCCASCGTKLRLLWSTSTLLFGWWGIPWGFIATPMQLFRNFSNRGSSNKFSGPSEELKKYIKLGLASQYVEAYNAQQESAPG